MICNHMTSKVWSEIISNFPNLNGSNFEVWEWVSKSAQHFVMVVIT